MFPNLQNKPKQQNQYITSDGKKYNLQSLPLNFRQFLENEIKSKLKETKWNNRLNVNAKIPSYSFLNDKHCKTYKNMMINMQKRKQLKEKIQNMYNVRLQNEKRQFQFFNWAQKKIEVLNQILKQVKLNSKIYDLMSKLQRLWTIKYIPDFYCYFFIRHLRKLTHPIMQQCLTHQIEVINNQQSFFHLINNLINSRQLSLRTLSQILQNLAEIKLCNQQEKTFELKIKDFSQQLNNYRKLTVQIIEKIKKWKETLRSMQPKSFQFENKSQSVCFFHNGTNYLIKMMNDNNFIFHSILADYLVFAQKNDPFVLKPFYINEEFRSNEAIKLLFILEPEFQLKQKIEKCMAILEIQKAETSKSRITLSEYVPRKISSSIQKIYHNPKMSNLIRDQMHNKANPKPNVEEQLKYCLMKEGLQQQVQYQNNKLENIKKIYKEKPKRLIQYKPNVRNKMFEEDNIYMNKQDPNESIKKNFKSKSLYMNNKKKEIHYQESEIDKLIKQKEKQIMKNNSDTRKMKLISLYSHSKQRDRLTSAQKSRNKILKKTNKQNKKNSAFDQLSQIVNKYKQQMNYGLSKKQKPFKTIQSQKRYPKSTYVPEYEKRQPQKNYFAQSDKIYPLKITFQNKQLNKQKNDWQQQKYKQLLKKNINSEGQTQKILKYKRQKMKGQKNQTQQKSKAKNIVQQVSQEIKRNNYLSKIKSSRNQVQNQMRRRIRSGVEKLEINMNQQIENKEDLKSKFYEECLKKLQNYKELLKEQMEKQIIKMKQQSLKQKKELEKNLKQGLERIQKEKQRQIRLKNYQDQKQKQSYKKIIDEKQKIIQEQFDKQKNQHKKQIETSIFNIQTQNRKKFINQLIESKNKLEEQREKKQQKFLNQIKKIQDNKQKEKKQLSKSIDEKIQQWKIKKQENDKKQKEMIKSIVEKISNQKLKLVQEMKKFSFDQKSNFHFPTQVYQQEDSNNFKNQKTMFQIEQMIRLQKIKKIHSQLNKCENYEQRKLLQKKLQQLQKSYQEIYNINLDYLQKSKFSPIKQSISINPKKIYNDYYRNELSNKFEYQLGEGKFKDMQNYPNNNYAFQQKLQKQKNNQQTLYKHKDLSYYKSDKYLDSKLKYQQENSQNKYKNPQKIKISLPSQNMELDKIQLHREQQLVNEQAKKLGMTFEQYFVYLKTKDKLRGPNSESQLNYKQIQQELELRRRQRYIQEQKKDQQKNEKMKKEEQIIILHKKLLMEEKKKLKELDDKKHQLQYLKQLEKEQKLKLERIRMANNQQLRKLEDEEQMKRKIIMEQQQKIREKLKRKQIKQEELKKLKQLRKRQIIEKKKNKQKKKMQQKMKKEIILQKLKQKEKKIKNALKKIQNLYQDQDQDLGSSLEQEKSNRQPSIQYLNKKSFTQQDIQNNKSIDKIKKFDQKNQQSSKTLSQSSYKNSNFLQTYHKFRSNLEKLISLNAKQYQLKIDSVLQKNVHILINQIFGSMLPLMAQLSLYKKQTLINKLNCQIAFTFYRLYNQQDEQIGIAFIHHKRDKISQRIIFIDHISTINQQYFWDFYLKLVQQIMDKDPCTQIEMILKIDQSKKSINFFIKQFQQKFEKIGKIYQKNLKQSLMSKKFVIKIPQNKKFKENINFKQNSFNNKFIYQSNMIMADYSIRRIDQQKQETNQAKNFLNYSLHVSQFFRHYLSVTQAQSIKIKTKEMLKLKQLLLLIVNLQQKNIKIKEIKVHQYINVSQMNFKLIQQGSQKLKIKQDQIGKNRIIHTKMGQELKLPFIFHSTILPLQISQTIKYISYFRLTIKNNEKIHIIKSQIYQQSMYILPTQNQGYKLLLMSANQFLQLERSKMGNFQQSRFVYLYKTLHEKYKIILDSHFQSHLDTFMEYIEILENQLVQLSYIKRLLCLGQMFFKLQSVPTQLYDNKTNPERFDDKNSFYSGCNKLKFIKDK